MVIRAHWKFRSTAAATMLIVLVAYAAALAQDPSSGQQPQTNSAKPNNTAEVETVVSRMTEVQYRNRQAIRPYIVTREYELFDDQSKQADSQVLAEVSFMPPGTKQYEIKQTHGSGRGEKVVRKVLDHEQAMASDWEDSALTGRNYKFEFIGEENLGNRKCFVLGIEPKRESKDLMRGKVWIDSQTYNPLRIVGSPAKSPSWWVKRVDLTLTFSDVNGMWLQTSATANADVRLFGKHMLTSRDLRYQTADMDAKNSGPLRRSRPVQGLGSAIIFGK